MNKTQLQQLRAKSTLVNKLGEDDEEFDIESLKKNKVDIFVRDITGPSRTLFDIFVKSSIDDTQMFSEAINILRAATENDIVIFNINSPGGFLSATQELLFEIDTTQAHTVAQVTGNASSAATMIALRCDEVFAAENSTWLFHNLQYSTGGDHGNIKQTVDFNHRLNERIVREAYELYLTEEEIQSILNGKELLLFGDEVMQRIEAAQQAAQENPVEVEGLLPEDTTHVEVASQDVKPKRKTKGVKDGN